MKDSTHFRLFAPVSAFVLDIQTVSFLWTVTISEEYSEQLVKPWNRWGGGLQFEMAFKQLVIIAELLKGSPKKSGCSRTILRGGWCFKSLILHTINDHHGYPTGRHWG